VKKINNDQTYKICIVYEHWTPKKGIFLKRKVQPTVYSSRQEAVNALRKDYPGEIYFPGIGGENLYEGSLLNKSGERKYWRIFKTRLNNKPVESDSEAYQTILDEKIDNR
jgi:hypothetical protein